jgi:hypothetical protein
MALHRKQRLSETAQVFEHPVPETEEDELLIAG